MAILHWGRIVANRLRTGSLAAVAEHRARLNVPEP
jgi:hypothetical protein